MGWKAAQKLIQNCKIVRGDYVKKLIKQGQHHQGGIFSVGAPLHVSNVQVVDPVTGKPCKIGVKYLEDGRRSIPCPEILKMRSTLKPTAHATHQPLSFSNTMFGRYGKLTRQIQTQSACIQGIKIAEKDEPRDSKAEALSDLKAEAMKASSEFSVTSSEMSKLKASSRHDLAMVFTCNVCETRSVKTCCRDSYENGVVVVRCGGCNNLHLMADRLGWFGEPGSVEDLLAARGDEFKKGAIDSLNLTLEDFAGKKL